MASKKQRVYLSLDKKVEVIRYVESHPSHSLRSLEEIFGCGETQISKILKNRESILASYQSNASSSRVHSISKARNSEYSDINDALYKWFKLATAKNIPVGGPQLIEKARMIADTLGKSNFRGSQGWLEKWKKRFGIKQFNICGESGDVQGETIDSWKERLPELVRDYSKDDIFNMDETGLFFRALPDRGFAQKSRSCKGGKRSKERITIALFVSAAGQKEKPVFIWKSETPRCLRGVNKAGLPVRYYSQKKAWMSGEILEDILTKFNQRLVRTNRKILLMMDNAGCHPHELVSRFSNIKILFLPPNTTSALQPLDLGIIQAFKIYCRKHFLRYVVSKIDESASAADVVKSVSILSALRWVALAWNEVRSETIIKCFKKAGVLDDTLGVIGLTVANDDSEDPFASIDETEFRKLMEQTEGQDHCCSPQQFVNGDDDLPICMGMDDDNWEATFLEELFENDDDDDADCDAEDGEDYEDGNNDTSNPPPKVMTYNDAINSLDEVCQFLEHKGHGDEAIFIGSSIDRILQIKTSICSQTTLHDYFETSHTM